MNPSFIPGRIPACATLGLAAVLVLPGCCRLPPAVQQSVSSVRETVAELHSTHAEDARAFAALVNEREAVLKEADRALRRAFQSQWDAEIAASRLRVLGEYDRRVGELLSVEFHALLKDQVYPAFDRLEHQQHNRYVDALRADAIHPDDPATTEAVRCALRDLYRTRGVRDTLLGQLYLSRAAALSRFRFRFETVLDQQYASLEQEIRDLLAGTQPTATDQLRADFNVRTKQRLADLDETYNSLDQALSDLSTYLDSEATNRRFAAHFLSGAATALIDDLKSGQLGAAALADILARSHPDFVAKLRTIEDRMKGQAATDAEAAAASVKVPDTAALLDHGNPIIPVVQP